MASSSLSSMAPTSLEGSAVTRWTAYPSLARWAATEALSVTAHSRDPVRVVPAWAQLRVSRTITARRWVGRSS